MGSSQISILFSLRPGQEDEGATAASAPAASDILDRMATTKKRTSTAKPLSRANGRTASNGIAPIRGKARREAIEALLERTSKDQGLSPEVAATLKDDAWGKRLVDP
jgi:hypothetical protein